MRAIWVPGKKLTCRLAMIPAIFALTVLLIGARAFAQTERILHSFSNNGGENPAQGLIFDSTGNLYGTTEKGGQYDAGTVFELSPNGSGGWTQTVLHQFGSGNDGQNPSGGSLLMDSAGNLYGTTFHGGTSLCGLGTPVGCGTVFELIKNSDGRWMEKVIYDFYGGVKKLGPKGYRPYGGLVMDSAGNLYGTTYYGGAYGAPEGNGGVVFELSPAGDGRWTEQVLWSFGGYVDDGIFPFGTLVFDSAGNLYGTTASGGGSSAGGIAFELSPGASGWTEAILFQFDLGGDSSTGNSPWAGVIFDSKGNLYGTTSFGGAQFMGDVFELSPPESGSGLWTETILHTFYGSNGENPQAGLIFDSKGNLYGTTVSGGTGGGGIVFELSPASDGGWTEDVLHDFLNDSTDGSGPLAGVVLNSSGSVFGTTFSGGTSNYGAVFEITP